MATITVETTVMKVNMAAQVSQLSHPNIILSEVQLIIVDIPPIRLKAHFLLELVMDEKLSLWWVRVKHLVI